MKHPLYCVVLLQLGSRELPMLLDGCGFESQGTVLLAGRCLTWVKGLNAEKAVHIDHTVLRCVHVEQTDTGFNKRPGLRGVAKAGCVTASVFGRRRQRARPGVVWAGRGNWLCAL